VLLHFRKREGAFWGDDFLSIESSSSNALYSIGRCSNIAWPVLECVELQTKERLLPDSLSRMWACLRQSAALRSRMDNAVKRDVLPVGHVGRRRQVPAYRLAKNIFSGTADPELRTVHLVTDISYSQAKCERSSGDGNICNRCQEHRWECIVDTAFKRMNQRKWVVCGFSCAPLW
jgi:hypothetical protein